MQHILVDIFLSYSFSSSIQTVEPTQKTHNDEKNLRRRGEQASIHVGCEQFRFFWDIHIWTPLLLTISQYKSTKCKLTSTILFQMTQNHKVLQSGFALNHYHHRWKIFITKPNLLRGCTTFRCRTEHLLLAYIKLSQKNGHSNLTLGKCNLLSTLNVSQTSTMQSGHTIMYWYPIYTNFRAKICYFSNFKSVVFLLFRSSWEEFHAWWASADIHDIIVWGAGEKSLCPCSC